MIEDEPYNNDKEDWDSEREAFARPASEEDQLPLVYDEPLPKRFWIEETRGLPVVRDRLYNDEVIARFITVDAAIAYCDLREVGVGHRLALIANPEFDPKVLNRRE